MSDLDYIHFIMNIKQKTGIDLSMYHEERLKTRLISGYEKRGLENFKQYFKHIMEDDRIFEEFLDYMTINVTEFFRNPAQWDFLQKKVLPKLLREKGSIISWSAGCSTGEEPFSLAMILSEMEVQQTKILATDLVYEVLRKAKKGGYGGQSLRAVPRNYLEKYFHTTSTEIQLKSHIQKTVVFQRQNLLFDSFIGDFDLILCRNVMIHLTQIAREHLYLKLNNALRPGGVLFIGTGDQMANPSNFGFESINQHFYQKIKSKTIFPIFTTTAN